MSSALEEKMAVWRLIEQHLGNELRPVNPDRRINQAARR